MALRWLLVHTTTVILHKEERRVGGTVSHTVPRGELDISRESEGNGSEGCVLLTVFGLKLPAADITKYSSESGSCPIQKPGLNEASAFAVKRLP